MPTVLSSQEQGVGSHAHTSVLKDVVLLAARAKVEPGHQLNVGRCPVEDCREIRQVPQCPPFQTRLEKLAHGLSNLHRLKRQPTVPTFFDNMQR